MLENTHTHTHMLENIHRPHGYADSVTLHLDLLVYPSWNTQTFDLYTHTNLMHMQALAHTFDLYAHTNGMRAQTVERLVGAAVEVLCQHHRRKHNLHLPRRS